MPKKNTLFLSILLFATAFILPACTQTGGYEYQPWDFNKQVYQGNAPSPQSRPGINPATNTPTLPPPNEIRAIQSENLPPVKVAILLPLSGKHQKLGQALLQSSQMALFDIGHSKFELMPRDTQGTPTGAGAAAKDALNNGAQLILGPVFADSVRAVKQETYAHDVNIIAFSTNASLADNKTFLMGFLPFDQIERSLGYAAQNNLNRIGIIAPNSEYGRTVISASEKIAPQLGINLTKISTFPANKNNLTNEVQAFANTSNIPTKVTPYDAVFMPVGGRSAVEIGNLLSQNGLPPTTVKRIGTGLFDDTGLARDSSLDSSIFAAPSPKLREDFERRFYATYGYKSPRIATLAYDATALAAILSERGFRTIGQPAFDKKSITNPNGFTGIDGIFRFRPNGIAERGLAILQFRHGRIAILQDAPKSFQAYRPF